MADLLYDRLSRRVKAAILYGMALIYCSIVGAIIYVAFHFISKFW